LFGKYASGRINQPLFGVINHYQSLLSGIKTNECLKQMYESIRRLSSDFMKKNEEPHIDHFESRGFLGQREERTYLWRVTINHVRSRRASIVQGGRIGSWMRISMKAHTKIKSSRTTKIRPRVKLWFEINGKLVFSPGVCQILQEIDRTGSIKD